jgi:hypothetical protein
VNWLSIFGQARNILKGDSVKSWQGIVIIFLITLAIGGGYLFYVFKQRQNPGIIPQNQVAQPLSKDDLAVVREFFPQHFEDLQRIEGTRVWMKSGYTMPYYPYTAGHVNFAKNLGLIPPVQPMDVNKFVKESVPAKVDDALEHGTRQVFAVFTLPGQTETLAMPVGATQGEEEHYYPDLLFYYDDPHKIYDNWSKDIWTAVDAHQVKPGMSELETRMAIGMKAELHGEKEGDRSVTYNVNGKHYTVTYEKDHATSIKSE